MAAVGADVSGVTSWALAPSTSELVGGGLICYTDVVSNFASSSAAETLRASSFARGQTDDTEVDFPIDAGTFADSGNYLPFLPTGSFAS